MRRPSGNLSAVSITQDGQTMTVTMPVYLGRGLGLLADMMVKIIQQRDGGVPLTGDMRVLLDELRAADLRTIASDGPIPTVGTTQARWLSVSDAAVQSGLSPQRIRELARGGRLICKRLDQRTWLVDADSINDYAKGRQSVA